jgi:putative tryptophan/tyrosine transport system substrate-binding protein
MNRRRFLLTSLAASVAAPLATEAQQIGKLHRIGLLGNAPEPAAKAYDTGLRERGWLEGQNFVWERRFSEGRNERFPSLAADLLQAKPDVIITVGTAPTVAAKAATTTVPIVFHAVGDPVGSGVVVSLSRPGGNATGLGGFGPGLHGKMLELLKEAVPRASRVGMLVNPSFALHTTYRREVEAAANRLIVSLLPVDIEGPDQLDRAFATAVKEKLDGLVILGHPMMFVFRERIARLALDHRMPAIIVFSEAVDAGLLMSYGDRRVQQLLRVSYYVDRILRGAKPADLPVELTTQFYLHVNLKTAKALGLTIPPSLLLRADQVIE